MGSEEGRGDDVSTPGLVHKRCNYRLQWTQLTFELLRHSIQQLPHRKLNTSWALLASQLAACCVLPGFGFGIRREGHDSLLLETVILHHLVMLAQGLMEPFTASEDRQGSRVPAKCEAVGRGGLSAALAPFLLSSSSFFILLSHRLVFLVAHIALVMCLSTRPFYASVWLLVQYVLCGDCKSPRS